jgi:hypothetical protein
LIEHIVAYSSRSNFGRNVLQENICILLKKTKQRSTIRVSLCEDASSTAHHELIIPKEQIIGDLWWLLSTPTQVKASLNNSKRIETLKSLGLVVRTGAIEIHRPQCKNHKAIRVIYSKDFNNKGGYNLGRNKKPRNFSFPRGTHQLPHDNSGFVVLKRITANCGEKNRLLPAWVSRKPQDKMK